MTTTQKNTPKLRFREFSEEWITVKFGSHASIVMGQSPDGDSYNKLGHGVPLINGPTEFTDKHPIKIQWTSKPTKICKPGDVLLCVRGSSTGRMNISDDQYCIGRGVAAVSFNEKSNPRYIQYLLEILVNKVLKLTSGSTFPNVDKKTLSEIMTAFPHKKEQEKIANFLTVLDEKIGGHTKKVELLEKYKKGVMQKIFSQEIRFKDEGGKEYPDWEEKKLGEILDYEQPTKYIVKSTEYSNSYKTPVLTAGKSFILGYTNESDNIYKDVPIIIFDDFTTSSQFVDFPFKVKSSAMKILKSKQFVNIKIAYEMLKSIKLVADDHKRYWIGEFQDLYVQLPSESEQEKIADFLTSLDDKIGLEERKLQKAKQFKSALLQQMFV